MPDDKNTELIGVRLPPKMYTVIMQEVSDGKYSNRQEAIIAYVRDSMRLKGLDV